MFLDDMFKSAHELESCFLDGAEPHSVDEGVRRAIAFYKYMYRNERTLRAHAGWWMVAAFAGPHVYIKGPLHDEELERACGPGSYRYRIGAAEEFFDITIGPEY